MTVTDLRGCRFAFLIFVILFSLPQYSGALEMVDIAGGSYTQNVDNDFPERTVIISGFKIGKYEVSYTEWVTVYEWALNNGYAFANAGAGKRRDHPVHSINWFDAVKWCNAKSEMEGLEPCYGSDAYVFRTGGDSNTAVPGIVRGANGYRLPTLAEWEFAAKAGQNDLYFPWGERINQGLANYNVDCFLPNTPSYDCDDGPTCGWHPTYFTGQQPYSAPVGAFPANAYGLHEIVGNMREWVWHWGTEEYMGDNPAVDPITTEVTQAWPWSGQAVMLAQGGSWMDRATLLWIDVHLALNPTDANFMTGFRIARSASSWDQGHSELGGSWRRLDWLGAYSVTGQWIYHEDHGFMAVSPQSTPTSIYFYTADMGWLWTRSSQYPYFYRFSDNAWLWYQRGSKNPRWFNNLSAGSWEQH